MTVVKLTPAQVAALASLANHTQEVRSAVFGAMMTDIKAQYGIPEKHKLRTGSTDHAAADYATLYRKKTGETYTIDDETGKWVGATTGQPVERKAWFLVNSLENIEDLVEGITGNCDFDDGEDTLDGGATTFFMDGHEFAVVSGDVFIQLNESDF